MCPNYNSAPTTLKFIQVTIENLQYPAMLDSGCTRTCIRSDLPFIRKIKKSDVELLCANNEKISPKVLCSNIKFEIHTKNGPITMESSPLVVENLSVPIILGLDCLQNFAYNARDNFVTLDSHQVKTVKPELSSKLVKISAIIEIDIQSNKEEANSLKLFQESRRSTAEKISFKPSIGNYGDATDEQKQNLVNLINKYRLSFSMSSEDLGKLHGFRFSLPTHDESKSSHQPPRPIPIHVRDQVEKEINEWKALGIITETQSDYNIPLIILKKPDKTIRISLDARGLNSLLIKDRYPLPHMLTLFNKIGEKLTTGNSCFISSLDYHRGYWQVQCESTDAHKLAFSFANKHYQANRMLYGTATAPSAFSRIMSKLMDHPSIIIYLDDLICIDSTFEDHLKTLEFIFKQCSDHGLLLSAKKCNLCMRETEFLGHQISRNGIQPSDKHIEAIKKINIPSSRKELKRYLGMVTFNAKYVKDASIILAPLYELTSLKNDFIWTETHQEAFETMNKELISKPTLGHFKLNSRLLLVTDSSGKTVGGTLYQNQSGDLVVLGYFSKALTGPDLKRSMRVKELFAMTWAIKHFEFYLLNTEFDCYVDHKSLLYLFREQQQSKLDIKLTNIHCYLNQFDFTIIHKPGNSPIMASADYFSRLPTSKSSDLDENSLKFEDFPDIVFMFHTQHADNNIIFSFGPRKFTIDEMHKLQNSCNLTKNKIIKLEKNKRSKFILKDRVLFSKNRLVLPNLLADEFIQYLHCITGHAGAKQLSHMCAKFYISNVQDKIRAITSSCPVCIQVKPIKKLKPSMIRNRHFESVPFERSFMDLVDYGRADSSNKRYLLTCCDALTGFLDGQPLTNKTDKSVAAGILTLVLRHGICELLVTDNGREFGPLCKQIFDRFGIRHVTTTAYRSCSNGKIERQHREIHIQLKQMNADDRNWSQRWELSKYYLNNLPKQSLDMLSSNEALYGRAFHVPYKLGAQEEDGATVPFIKALNNYIKELHPSIQAFQVQRYQKLLEKDRNNCPVLELGTKVLAWKPNIADGKLGTNWSGPFFVHKRISKDSYILKCTDTSRTYRRHISLIRPLKTKIGNTTEFKKLQCLSKDNSDDKNDTPANEIDKENNEVETSSENCELVKRQFHEISPLPNLQVLDQEQSHEENQWSKRLRPRK
jgi:hypothetical protein